MQINTLNSDFQYCYHSILLRVNPRILIGNSSYIGIYVNTPSENGRLILALNECLPQIGLTEYFSLELGQPCLCAIEDFRISRLDLCVNYQFPSAYLLSSYLKLMRRGNRLSFLTEPVIYDSIAKRKLPYKHALFLSASSFDICIYDKAAQMEDNIAFFKEIPPEATGLLRFEIQLRREKLKRALQKSPNTSLLTVLAYTPELCRMEFGRYTKSLFCTGNYYTLQDAKALIVQHETPYSACKKIQFLENVSANRSLEQTIKEYERDDKSCRYLLEGLAKLGINPVTIPEKWFGPHALLHSIPALLGFCPPTDPEQIQE